MKMDSFHPAVTKMANTTIMVTLEGEVSLKNFDSLQGYLHTVASIQIYQAPAVIANSQSCEELRLVSLTDKLWLLLQRKTTLAITS